MSETEEEYFSEEEQGEDKPPKPSPEQAWWRRILNFWETSQMAKFRSMEAEIRITLRELMVYGLFLILLLISAFGMSSRSMFYYTRVMTQLFIDTGTPEGETFRSASTISDFWSFAQSVMIDNFFWEHWYRDDDEPETAEDDKKILYENELLGLPRLRQVKVRSNSCIIHEEFRRSFVGCYGMYSANAEDIEPFGPGIKTAWQYSTHHELGGMEYWGKLATYMGGGYYQNLPTDERSDMEDTVAALKDNLWIRRGTRAVFLDFTVYNANLNLFCIVKLILELPPTGGVIPSWSFRTVKLLRYVTKVDYFILGCELMVVAFIFYYTCEEIREIIYFKQRYFCNGWNWLDMFMLLVAYICIIFSIIRTIVVKRKLDALLEDKARYYDFEHLGFWEMLYNNQVALLVFFSFIKIFKYVRFNQTMTQLSNTLSRCAKDILGFGLMFFIVFIAFAQLGHLLFGTEVENFSTFTRSIFTLLRTILGDFDYDEIERANRILGPIFFMSYIFFVFFVLLNMFLAIINDAYSEVKEELTRRADVFEICNFLKRGFNNLCYKLGWVKKKPEPEEEKDQRLTGKKIRKLLQESNFNTKEIDTFFSKYDITNENEELPEEEARKMLQDLQRKSLDDIVKPGEVPAYQISPNEFYMLNIRVDRMEKAVENVIDRVDAMISNLEELTNQ